MLKQNWVILVILLVMSIMVGGYWAGWAAQVEDVDGDGYADWYVGMGIYAAPSGQAVYIGGEACTINMTSERNNQYDLARDFEFCRTKHLELYPVVR